MSSHCPGYITRGRSWIEKSHVIITKDPKTSRYSRPSHLIPQFCSPSLPPHHSSLCFIFLATQQIPVPASRILFTPIHLIASRYSSTPSDGSYYKKNTRSTHQAPPLKQRLLMNTTRNPVSTLGRKLAADTDTARLGTPHPPNVQSRWANQHLQMGITAFVGVTIVVFAANARAQREQCSNPVPSECTAKCVRACLRNQSRSTAQSDLGPPI